MTSLDELQKMGMTATVAKRLIALSPLELLAVMPIRGNAWQDMPLFEAIRDVLGQYRRDMTPAGMAIKKLALQKGTWIVGSYYVKGELDTDAGVQRETDAYLE